MQSPGISRFSVGHLETWCFSRLRTGLGRVMRSYFRTDVNRALLSVLRIIKHMPHAWQAVTDAQAPEHRHSEPASWGNSHAANKLALMDQWPWLILANVEVGAQAGVECN